MAAQSKLLHSLSSASLSSSRSLRTLLSRLTAFYATHRAHISRGVYLTLFLALISRVRNAISEQKFAQAGGELEKHQEPRQAHTKKPKVELNREFFRNLWQLLRIVIPGVRSKEARLLVMHTVFLVVRTLISLYVAELDGRLVSALVRGKGREFLGGVLWWMCVAVPATFTNSMVGSWLSPINEALTKCPPVGQLSYHQCKLALQYRTRLTQHIQDKYLSNLTFYSLGNLDDRIKKYSSPPPQKTNEKERKENQLRLTSLHCCLMLIASCSSKCGPTYNC